MQQFTQSSVYEELDSLKVSATLAQAENLDWPLPMLIK